MKRRFPECPSNQLASLVTAAALTGNAVDQAVVESTSPPLLQAAAEAIIAQKRNPESGRTLEDAITVEGQNGGTTTQSTGSAISALHLPIRIAATASASSVGNTDRKNGPKEASRVLQLPTSYGEAQTTSANSFRHFFDMRERHTLSHRQLSSMKRSLQLQRANLEQCAIDRRNLLAADNSMDASTRLVALDEIKETEAGCQRVIAQLERQMAAHEAAHESITVELEASKKTAEAHFQSLRGIVDSYRDPVGLQDRVVNNRVLSNVLARQSGLDRGVVRGLPYVPRRTVIPRSIRETNQLILKRLSHAVTINTHLSYPVYCLRFDRTGRYFITGADDYLVRVFRLGENIRSTKSMDRSTYRRGAVLVCTLKGHNGVINDIDVSSDNSLLATASEDGDCRVWGLRDGCPVAILRGHTGGANMVCPTLLWSIFHSSPIFLTPFI